MRLMLTQLPTKLELELELSLAIQQDEAECGKICVHIFHIKVGILHMEYFSDVYTMI